MAYEEQFKLVYGGTTVLFAVRPGELKIDPDIMVAEQSIPGGLESVIQSMGSNSHKFTFSIPLYDTRLISVTGGTIPSDVVDTLQDWARNGRDLDFYCDYVTNVLGGAYQHTKIMKLDIVEKSGIGYHLTDRVATYVINITLVGYSS